MEKVVMFFLFVLLATMVSAQNISNVDFHQEGDEIVITYDLDESSPIGVYVSLDGGKSYKEMRSIQGDVGKSVLPGKKRMVWKVLDDIPDGLVGQCQFEVSTNLFVSGKDFIETALGINMKMVYVKGGDFLMGGTLEQGEDVSDEEKPIRRVTLDSYYIGAFEITQRQWERVMGNNPSYFKKGDNYPVECVSWEDVQVFCRRLSDQTGKKYVLPTEAQWEYAARGRKSKDTKYSGSWSADAVAWNMDNSGRSTHPVGTKRPNALGLYDMSGNVWEWCQDWSGKYRTDDILNPTGASSRSYIGPYRVLRGGSYYAAERCGAVAGRGCGIQNERREDYGFRVVFLP